MASQTITPAQVGDVLSILDKVYGVDLPVELAARLEGGLRTGADAGLVVRVDGEAVACVVAHRRAKSECIHCLAVLEDHRRQGHARTLVQRLMDELRATGPNSLLVAGVEVGNTWLIEFYEALGFTLVTTSVGGFHILYHEFEALRLERVDSTDAAPRRRPRRNTSALTADASNASNG